MKGAITQFNSGHFPFFTHSQYFNKTIYQAFQEIFGTGTLIYLKDEGRNPDELILGEKFHKTLMIRELYPEKYRIYLEEIIRSYTPIIDNLEYFIWRNKEKFVITLLPEKQKVKVVCPDEGKFPWFKESLQYAKEFSADTPLSTIKESIDSFLRKKAATEALKELEGK